MAKNKYSDEAIFCAKYLSERGFLSKDNLDELAALFDDFDADFNLVKVPLGYFPQLAKALRELWPSGEKDGRYAWRDSIGNLSRRLETLWAARNLQEIPIETCTMVARRYLAQYENDKKYMQTLKYFILKQGKIVGPDGGIKYIQQSQFADMLESVTEEDKQQAEWESMFEQSNTIEQGGVLI